MYGAAGVFCALSPVSVGGWGGPNDPCITRKGTAPLEQRLLAGGFQRVAAAICHLQLTRRVLLLCYCPKSTHYSEIKQSL